MLFFFFLIPVFRFQHQHESSVVVLSVTGLVAQAKVRASRIVRSLSSPALVGCRPLTLISHVPEGYHYDVTQVIGQTECALSLIPFCDR